MYALLRCVLQIIVTGGSLEDSQKALDLARTNGKNPFALVMQAFKCLNFLLESLVYTLRLRTMQ